MLIVSRAVRTDTGGLAASMAAQPNLFKNLWQIKNSISLFFSQFHWVCSDYNTIKLNNCLVWLKKEQK